MAKPPEMFKPEFDGARPATRMTGPERQTFRLGKADLVRRVHEAMLTLSVLDGVDRLGLIAGGTPEHIVEFADRVGEAAAEVRRVRFRPTAAQVSALGSGLALLDGLTKPFFKVVMLRAMHEFAKDCGEPGDWPWSAIGGMFGLSEAWAEGAYDAAMVQAARRAGVLPMVQADYSVVVAAVWAERAWLTNISTAADPRQAVANLKVKSPLRFDQALAIWVPGQPVAKRLVETLRAELRGLLSHGSWYKANPDSLAEKLIARARDIGSTWLLEDIPVKGALAA